MYGDLLPIGSVVLLKNGTKRLMIVSRIGAMEDSNIIFDYIACAYPEGINDSKKFYYFNRDAIDRLYFIGFQDSEELAFRTEVLASLGELYINDEGQIVEREKPEEAAEEPADETSDGLAPIPVAPGSANEETIEAPVFAEV